MSKLDKDLEALEARISALKEASSSPKAGSHAKAEGDAVRIVSDFIAAALVGTGLGYGFDAWQETSPWGLVVGLMIGSAAGLKIMWQREASARKTTKRNDNA